PGRHRLGGRPLAGRPSRGPGRQARHQTARPRPREAGMRPRRLLQASTALRLRAATRPSSVVLTDIHGDLTARDLLDLVHLIRRRSRERAGLADLPPHAPLREVRLTALAGRGDSGLRPTAPTRTPRCTPRAPLTPGHLPTLADRARRTGLRA